MMQIAMGVAGLLASALLFGVYLFMLFQPPSADPEGSMGSALIAVIAGFFGLISGLVLLRARRDRKIQKEAEGGEEGSSR